MKQTTGRIKAESVTGRSLDWWPMQASQTGTGPESVPRSMRSLEVTLFRAGLVLRWVTIHEYTILIFNQATQANSAWSSLRG